MSTKSDFRPVTGYGSIRYSDVVHDQCLKKAAKMREDRTRKCIAEDLCEEIEDFEHKMGWRMRSRIGLKGAERREIERTEQRTMGIKAPAEPRPKSPLGLYDYSQSPTVLLSRRQPLPNHGVSVRPGSTHDSPCTSLNMTSRFSNFSSISSPIRVRSAPTAGAGPLRNSSRLWTPHSMIEPIFLPCSSAHRSASDHLALANLAYVIDEARKLSSTGNPRSIRSSSLSISSDDQILSQLGLTQSSHGFRRSKPSSPSKKYRNGYPTLNPSTRSEMEFQRMIAWRERLGTGTSVGATGSISIEMDGVDAAAEEIREFEERMEQRSGALQAAQKGILL